jgi:D-3-phosphoglycerate dehydrogenase
VKSNGYFRVGITRDIRRSDGGVSLGDIGLSLLEEARGVEWSFLDRDVSELTSELLSAFDAVFVWGPAITRKTLVGLDRLSLVVRLGVGYDEVDVDALTENGIALAITPDGVRRPMASAAVAFILALGHRLVIKDHLVRVGDWQAAYDHIGVGLAGRTLGVIGLGNIGRELLELIRPFGMRHLVADPYSTTDEAAGRGAELVALDELLGTADFVCITCPLTAETHHLIDAERIALMRPDAYLVNVARGPILDQKALAAALAEGRIAGAALDVFEQEPIPAGDPLLKLENVVLAPHAIGATDELFATSGRTACRAALALAHGDVPMHIVNPTVLEQSSFRAKLAAYAHRNGSAA